jgi:hypothetical protein
MDPYFVGALIGTFLAYIPPGHAGVVCDRRGFCVAQPQFQQQNYPPPPVITQSFPQQRPQDALGAKIRLEVYEFCSRHPEEPFCGDVRLYLQLHPETP